jgi:hypothetical protein
MKQEIGSTVQINQPLKKIGIPLLLLNTSLFYDLRYPPMKTTFPTMLLFKLELFKPEFKSISPEAKLPYICETTEMLCTSPPFSYHAFHFPYPKTLITIHNLSCADVRSNHEHVSWCSYLTPHRDKSRRPRQMLIRLVPGSLQNLQGNLN